ncbi:STAS domain-containing protein [Streptomyces sp. NPDC053493]|uniref:STAS domain-containing protein n=1 Tax=Streptomyces sp. NPDC053493 TaxID=3365705 RepID=UPI0037D0A896
MISAQFVPRSRTVTGPRTYRAASGTARVVREPGPEGGTVVLAAIGEFDVETVGCLARALAEARHEGCRRTVLDVSRVEFGDSSFLHVLVTAHFAGRPFVLMGPVPRQLRQLFAMTGTLRLFTFTEDRAGPGFA